jgi:adenylate cyclase
VSATGWLALALAATTAVLAWLLHRARNERRALRERVENSTRELQNLQLSFSRFTPDEVIERVIAEGIDDRGEKKDVTVLFADIVGFTPLSESVDPTVLVRILNGYFERMSDAIAEHRGHVATFIGDGLLAFFGAHAPNPWQANDAVHAALQMRASLADYNRVLEREGLRPLGIGIGLHCGPGVAGLVGSKDLKEFAFVGRTVNVAARVQDLTRSYEADIILTEALREKLDPRFQLTPLPDTPVKGVSEPLVIHAVDGFDAGA